MPVTSTGPSTGSPEHSPQSVSGTGPATGSNGKVIYVSSAQVKAAQLLVDQAKRRKEAVDPAVVAIANAKRANGYVATLAAT